MTSSAYADILERIAVALDAARVVFRRFTPGTIEAEYKIGHDPVTEADRAVDEVLRQNLLREGEGWLSEESVDDKSRLSKSRVWIVDPLDGTREFVAGIPEFCVSIGFVENGRPVAGGIYNPATDEVILGAIDSGVRYNGTPARSSRRTALQGSLILASRSEVKRGEWKQFQGGPFEIRAMGSVAYKLALVAAGRADVTFTLTPKHEWDVAAGAALVLSAGGVVTTLDNRELRCNQKNPLLAGLIGCGPNLSKELIGYLKSFPNPSLAKQDTKKDTQKESLSSTRGIPLSSTQERLWVLDQLHPRNPAQNLACGLRLAHLVDKGALQSALDAVVERHEILRTEFRMVDGTPVQVVLPHARIALNAVSLRHLAPHEREAQLFLLGQQETQNPFELSSGPLLRAVLFQLTDTEYVLLVLCHRIVCDEESLRLLLSEANSLYHARMSRESQAVAKMPMQYREVAAQDPPPSAVELSYWKQRLEGAPSSIDLPGDRQRPPVQSFRGEKQRMSIEAPLLERLRTLGQSHDASLFTTLLAAFSVLLSRYARQEDLVLGTHISGRDRPELESLIGPLENMLALRMDTSGDPSFAELLSRVREGVEQAFSHQSVPFEAVVRELHLERDMSRHPIFQIAFSMKETASASFATDLKLVEVESPTEPFDLTVEFAEDGNEFFTRFSYNSDLFEASTIARMLEHFWILLESAADDPGMRISRLPLLRDAERQQVLVEWNETRIADPGVECLHQFFEEQVERTPQAAAVECDGKSLTYRELNERANRLAHYLRKRKVGPEVLVGICAERSLEMLVGILGILKAGGAYVPLDPAYPKDRLEVILADAKAPILLTQERLKKSLGQQVASLILLDSDWPEITQEPATNPTRNVNSANLDYVLFTSGSTGRPKGVALEHRSAVTFIQWARHVFLPEEVAGTLFSTSICFDLSVFEIFVPLSMGGAIIIAQNALALPKLRAAREVTLINTVPSAIAELVRLNAVPPSVRVVNLAGEALLTALAHQIYNKTQVGKVYNLYGPTEDTTYSTYTLVPPGAEVTIGRPLPNTQAYILDENREPVPIGVPGELYLAGDGLARGYFGREDLTAERFVPNPYSSQPGARMYRTGDLTRFLKDGNIEYLGRLDHQVKVRGFRIELEEIENVLVKQAGVQAAVVVAREDTPGDKRLVAYIVPSGASVPAARLQDLIRKRLPEYMVPGAFVELKQLPLSPNGKINRRLLPPPERTPFEGSSVVPPRNDLELTLLEIWKRVLGVENIGVRDDFFDLGGHSLKAARLLAEVEKAVGTELPLSALFRGATVESLAGLIQRESESGKDPVVMEIQHGESSRLPFFAIVPPGEEALGYAMLARHMGPGQTVYKIQGHAPVLDGSRPYAEQEMRDLTEEYIAAMRSVQPHGPYCLGGLCDGTHIAEQIVLSLESQREEVGLFAIFDTWVLQHSQIRWLWKVDYYRRWLRKMKGKKLTERLASYKAVAENKVNLLTGKGTPRTDWQQAYWPEDFSPPRFRAPVVLFKRPKQQFYYINDPQMGWGRRSEGGVEIHEIDFHHQEILREPHVRRFGVELAKYMARVSRRILKPEPSTESQPASSTVSVQPLRQGS